MAFSEQDMTNEIASQERSIAGVKNSYNFDQNPDIVATAQLPAVVHYIPEFNVTPRGHFNTWENVIEVRSVLMVAPRETRGAKLRYLENAAIPFGNLFRTHFQQASVLRTLLSNTSATKAWLIRGQYGAGGPLLTYGNDVEYIGWIFNYRFVNA